ncbi:hypothetical protein GDO78_020140 [Eleutherodactylus coqui]|uniref:Uncharacterized protein n=1 Tax=Eleutherodactylus coqui TaxID=57060 RepID=A0A8J6EIA8_ELECQ|nr:hypothetical protein GDO78_020140 [Eleutherodactylus coqui]
MFQCGAPSWRRMMTYPSGWRPVERPGMIRMMLGTVARDTPPGDRPPLKCTRCVPTDVSHDSIRLSQSLTWWWNAACAPSTALP